jgi:hypothetical protein
MHFEPTTLMTGAVLSAFAASFAGQGAFADPTEPVTLEARNSIRRLQLRGHPLRPCPAYARETHGRVGGAHDAAHHDTIGHDFVAVVVPST